MDPLTAARAACRTARERLHGSGRRGLETAKRLFGQAVENCPDHAPAHAGLADVHAVIYQYQDKDPATCERARQLAERALALDPELAEAHAALGHALMVAGDADGAEAAFAAALERQPDLFQARYYHARLLFEGDRTEEAAEEMQRAHELLPTDYQSALLLCTILADLDQPERLVEWRERGVRVALEHLGEEPDDERAMYLVGSALAAMGQSRRAIEMANRAILMAPGPDTFYNVACLYSVMGDHDTALDMLERADIGSSDRDWILHDTDLAPLREHPRFVAMVERAGTGEKRGG